MAFIPVPECALAVLEWGLGAYRWTNTLWFQHPTFTQPDMLALANDMLDFAQNHMFAHLQNEVDYKGCKIYDMRTEDGYIQEGVGSAFGGARAGDPAPLTAAICVTLYTNTRGRSGRGRNYVTGLSETDCGEGGVEDPTVWNGIQDAYNELNTITLPHGWSHVVVSTYFEGAPRVAGVYDAVTNAVIRSTLWASQRRRIARP